jgi:hypothetical protein
MARDKDKPERVTNAADESVADFARREVAEAAERERKKQLYLDSQAKIVAELPARFLKLADKIRAEVDTFNKIVEPSRRISMTESAGLAARADVTRAELNLTLRRKAAEGWVGVSELMRLGKAPAAYVIEARIKLTQARVRIRVEGLPKDGGVRYRVTIDGKEGPIELEDLASKIVLAIAKDDPTVLGAGANAV